MLLSCGFRSTGRREATSMKQADRSFYTWKQSDELEKYGTIFVKLVKRHLLACKDELEFSVNFINALVDNLRNLNEREDEASTSFSKVLLESNSLEIFEQEYLQVERKVLSCTLMFHTCKWSWGSSFYASRLSAPYYTSFSPKWWVLCACDNINAC